MVDWPKRAITAFKTKLFTSALVSEHIFVLGGYDITILIFKTKLVGVEDYSTY